MLNSSLAETLPPRSGTDGGFLIKKLKESFIMELKFEVIGKIQPKQRPRFVRRGAFIQTYTPEATLKYQNLVAEAYKTKYKDMKLDGALIVEIGAFFNVPKSYSKKRKRELYGKPNVQHNGDIDNVAKSVLDGLNGVAWDDDTIVYDLHITKWYTLSDEDPERVEIKINGGNL